MLDSASGVHDHAVYAIDIETVKDSKDTPLLRQEISSIQSLLLRKSKIELRIYSSERTTFRLYLAIYTREPHERQTMLVSKAEVLGWHTMLLDADCLPPLNGDAENAFAVVQVNCVPKPGQRIAFAECRLTVAPSLPLVPMRFRFDTFGDFSKASARLRAHKLIEVLRSAGHSVHVNEGDACDVYVCQKVRPFDQIRKWKGPRPLIVFDFDDNYFLKNRGSDESLLSFMNTADLVTVGSEELFRAASSHHPNVHLLENPVDILSDELVREAKSELKEIGWFGAPENLSQLKMLPDDINVVTVTKGGDIEFDIYAVDEVLTRFDLLVFPLYKNQWNLSKNANRLIKAVALGVPVLASDTPEHARVAEQLGLSARYLVPEGGDWRAAIQALSDDYVSVQEEIAGARERANILYSKERVADEWLANILAARRRHEDVVRYLPDQCEYARGRLAQVDVIIDDISSESRFEYSTRRSEVDWSAFGGRHIVSLSARDNRALAISEFSFLTPAVDIQEAYLYFDEIVDKSTAEFILYIPAGYKLLFGFERYLSRWLEVNQDLDLGLFTSAEFAAPPDEVPFDMNEIAESVWNPRVAGVLVIRREWLRDMKLTAWSVLSYWSWAVVLFGVLSGATLKRSEIVVTQRSRPRTIENMSIAFAKFAQGNWAPDQARSFPNGAEQWLRISFDIVEGVMSRFKSSLPWLVASGFQTMQRQRDELERARSDLKRSLEAPKVTAGRK